MQTRRLALWGLVWAWALWLGSALPAWAGSTGVVARVALAVGDAYRIGPNHDRYSVSVGTELRETDTVVTGPAGMLVIVFVDQARLAVRPNTELVIRRYRIDPAGVDTDMDIALVRGVVRQISGAAAQTQPERYRLNTPIAVIGVRGTDFLAKVGPQQDVQTYVHEGAVVVMSTLPGGPGPDRQDAAVLRPLAMISAGDAAPYARILADGAVERRHVNPAELEAIFGIRIDAAALSAGRPGTAAGAGREAPQPSVAVLVSAIQPTPSVGLPEQITEQLQNRGPVQALPAPVPAPVIPLPEQLVWGRFDYARDLPWTLSVPYAEASQGRHPVVGEPGQYALWRAGPAGRELEPGLSGRLDFALAAADALLIGAQRAEPVSVSSPRLTVDFDQRRFETQLVLQAAGLPAQTLQAGGRIATEGRFIDVRPGQRVAGALSFNGREAGYLFNLQAREGLYQGMTLWSAR